VNSKQQAGTQNEMGGAARPAQVTDEHAIQLPCGTGPLFLSVYFLLISYYQQEKLLACSHVLWYLS
jgi:hypothetical protein